MLRPAVVARALDVCDRPVLVVHGDRDWLVPIGVARRLCAGRGNWELAAARGVGHVPMLEAPEWTAGTVGRWLDGAGAPAAAASRGSLRGWKASVAGTDPRSGVTPSSPAEVS